MSKLTQNQLILIDDFKDDITFYKEDLDNQIKSHRIMLFAAIGIAVVLGGCLIAFPNLLKSVQEYSEHLGILAGLVTETIPVTFASKSFNKGKLIKKKLIGLRTFEKRLSRMEQGILPNTKENILMLEEDFVDYINT